jgi:hypothetical protein
VFTNGENYSRPANPVKQIVGQIVGLPFFRENWREISYFGGIPDMAMFG